MSQKTSNQGRDGIAARCPLDPKTGHANDDTAAVCAVLEAKAERKRRKSR